MEVKNVVTYFRCFNEVEFFLRHTLDRALKMRPALEFLCNSDPSLKSLVLTKTNWTLLSNNGTPLQYFKTLSSTRCGEEHFTLPLIVYYNLIYLKCKIN